MAQDPRKETLHFCLSPAFCSAGSAGRDGEWKGMTVNIGGRKYPLKRHSRETLAQAARDNMAIAFLSESAQEKITAYAQIESEAVNRQALSMVMVQEEQEDGRLPVLHHFSYFIPEKYHAAVRNQRQKERLNIGETGSFSGICAKMQFLEEGTESGGNFERSAATDRGVDLDVVNRDAHYLMTDMDTAASILFTHVKLGNNKPYTAAVIMDEAIMPDRDVEPEQFYQMYLFAKEIQDQGPDRWAVRDVARDYRGKPIVCQNEALGYKKGDQIEIYQLSERTLQAAAAPVNGALRLSENNEKLQNTNWTVNIGYPVTYGNTKVMKATGGLNWTADKKGSHHGLEMVEDSIRFQNKRLTVAVKNHFIRTMGAYAQFLDDAGKGIANPEGWEEKLDESARELNETDEKKFMGLVTPINSIMGIPFPAQPTEFTFHFPDNAVKVRLLFGTLGFYGYDEDKQVNLQGAMLTGVFQFAIPAFLLALSTIVEDGKILTDLMMGGVTALLNVIFAVTGVDGTESIDAERIISILGDALAGILLQHGAEKLLLYLTGMVTKQQLEQQIPVLGWALKVYNVSVGTAGLIVATGEMISSPATLQIEVRRTTDLELTLHPDPAHGEKGKPETAVWPLLADNYKIVLTYEGSTNRELTGKIEKGNKPLRVTFSEIPAGGRCQVSANLYSKEDWLCGVWKSDWMAALPNTESGIRLDGSIEEQLIPLTADTQYDLVYNKTYENGVYCWREKHEIPKDTIDVLDEGGYRDGLCRLLNLSLNEAKQWMGFTYRASGSGLPDFVDGGRAGNACLAQGMSKIGDGKVRSSLCEKGFKQDVLFALDKYGEGEDNYLLEPMQNTFELRKIDLSKDDFDLRHSREKSCGTFHLKSIDALAVHPDRKVIAASWKENVVEVLDLKAHGKKGKGADGITMCGQGSRQGLLHGPTAMTVTADGRILVLESTNRRIQAFDSSMNPVPCFTGEKIAGGVAGCVSRLEQGIVPEELLNRIGQAGDTFAGEAAADEEIRKELEAHTLSERLLGRLFDVGIYPASGIDPQTGKWKYLSVEKGSKKGEWILKDACQEKSWKLRDEGSALEITRVLNHIRTETVAAGKEWALHDTEMARSYRIVCTDEKKGLVDIYRKEAFVRLHSSGNCVLLDLAAEEKGYLYVLYYRNGGHMPQDYLIDIYTPEGKWLTQLPDTKKHPNQPHIVAGKLDVDHFRTLFAMHFESEKGNNGRREPKLTQWIPGAPKQ